MSSEVLFIRYRTWRSARGRGVLAAMLFSCCVLGPLHGHAQERDEVQTYLLSARRHYDNLEYEQALAQLTQARSLTIQDEDSVLLSLYEGIILADLLRNDAADAAFKAALFLRPDSKLPEKASPKVERRFEDIRKQVKRELERHRRIATVEPRGRVPLPANERPADDVPVSGPVAEIHPTPLTVSAPQATPTVTDKSVSLVTQASERSTMRSRAWIPAAVGGALLVGGGVAYSQAWSERSRLRDNDARLETLQDANRSASRGSTLQTVGLGLASAGVVGMGVSIGMYLLGSPSVPDRPGVSVTTDGTSAFMIGRWP